MEQMERWVTAAVAAVLLVIGLEHSAHAASTLWTYKSAERRKRAALPPNGCHRNLNLTRQGD